MGKSLFLKFSLVKASRTINRTILNCSLKNVKKFLLDERILVCSASVCLFAYLTNFKILDYSNTSWVSWSDHGHQYYAWEYFRRAEFLQWPITRNPQYAIGFENLIGFPTGFATMALSFKLFLFWTKTPIQYFGYGIFILFVLQGQMALRLLRNFNLSRSSRAFGSVIFLLSPLFLHRFAFGTTLAMIAASHFLILWAFDNYYRTNSGFISWIWVLVISAIIEPYILAMNLAIYFAWYFNELYKTQAHQIHYLRFKKSIRFIVVCIVPISFLYLLGSIGFTSTRSKFGFGFFRSDLMSVVNSALTFPDMGLAPIRWSEILPSKDLPTGLAEGFGYIGIVSILGLFIFLFRIITGNYSSGFLKSVKRKHLLLLLAVSIMAVHGSSGVFSFGGSELFQVNYPSILEPVNQSFRATGRFIWPLAYLLTLFSIIILTSAFEKVSRKRRVLIIFTLIVLQIVDQRSGFEAVRMQFTEPEYVRSTISSHRLTSSDWENVAGSAPHLQVLLPLSNSPIWEDVLGLAFRADSTTNAGILARVEESQVRNDVLATIRELRKPVLNCDRVYLIPLDEVSRARLKVLYSRLDLDSFLRKQQFFEGRKLQIIDNVQVIGC